MAYAAKNFEHLLGLSGFSDTLLTNHFTLYEGYVKNTNALVELLSAKTPGTPEYSELQRRLGWEWNGMRLHELHFENLSKEPAALGEGTLLEKITATYGSLENWEKNFTSIGAMRGVGWTLLVHDTLSGELHNIWVNEHDLGHLAGCTPLLVMDVFEHAYITDYGIKRAEYISAFMHSIDWNVVQKRFENH